jgi:O-acetyl-ADP-ribose deacetylase (regulator of RNase III)
VTLTHATGDLFDWTGRAALAHGVNCRGVMGAGIAPQFKRRWPAMFARYRTECQTGVLTLGGMMPWRDPTTGQVVYNLATQDRPGPHATLDAIRSSLALTVAHAATNGIPAIAMPRIGAGKGGLPWGDVLAVITDVADTAPVEVKVVTLPPR